MPFTDPQGARPPHLQLEPKGSHDFIIIQGFKYVVPGDGGAEYEVKGTGETTDLASVPFFLQWFVRSYGKHTLAAVLHDHLWRSHPAGVRLDDAAFKEANRVFRVAMDELEVPFVRRWLMWAAVSLAWLWKRGPAWKIRVGAWVAAIVGLVAITGWVLVRDVGAPAQILAAILAVASLVLLWPHVVVAAIGAPVLYLLAPSIVVVLATLLAFVVIEAVFYAIGLARRPLAHLLGRPVPRRPHRPLFKREPSRRAQERIVTVPEAKEDRPAELSGSGRDVDLE